MYAIETHKCAEGKVPPHDIVVLPDGISSRYPVRSCRHPYDIDWMGKTFDIGLDPVDRSCDKGL